MIKAIYIKSDLKQLFREPMMALLFMLPLFMAPLFKLILTFLVPFMQRFIQFDIQDYYSYILSFMLLFVPGMLGVVMGFMLLDDKDGKTIELLSITPLGRKGYLTLRIGFVAFCSFIYTLYSYGVIGIYILNLFQLLYISLLLSIYSAIVGLLFINLATDKVKGLTYAKGLNILMFFVLADLLRLPWLTAIANLTPTYWVYMIIKTQSSLWSLMLGLVIHCIWFMMMLRISLSNKLVNG
jgi:fluoroquinolone transport system permease protein